MLKTKVKEDPHKFLDRICANIKSIEEDPGYPHKPGEGSAENYIPHSWEKTDDSFEAYERREAMGDNRDY